MVITVDLSVIRRESVLIVLIKERAYQPNRRLILIVVRKMPSPIIAVIKNVYLIKSVDINASRFAIQTNSVSNTNVLIVFYYIVNADESSS